MMTPLYLEAVVKGKNMTLEKDSEAMISYKLFSYLKP